MPPIKEIKVRMLPKWQNTRLKGQELLESYFKKGDPFKIIQKAFLI